MASSRLKYMSAWARSSWHTLVDLLQFLWYVQGEKSVMPVTGMVKTSGVAVAHKCGKVNTLALLVEENI